MFREYRLHRIVLVVILLCVGTLVYAEDINQVIPFDRDITVDGVYGDYTTSFIINESISSFNGGRIMLRYSLSQLTRHRSSNITIELNGTKFHSIPIDKIVTQSSVADVILPARLIRDGYNELRIIVFNVSDESNICFDEINPGNWLVLEKESYIEINQTLSNKSHIKDYPYPYISPNDNTPDEITFIFNRDDENLLNGFFNICADIGRRNKGDEIRIRHIDIKDIDSLRGNAMYIGYAEDIEGDIKELLTPEDQVVLQEDSLIRRVAIPGDDGMTRYLLLLLAKDKAGLDDIQRFMLNDNLINKVAGDKIVIVDGLDDVKNVDKPSVIPVKDMGYGDLYKIGMFNRIARYSIDLPKDWRIKRGSKFVLRCRYSSAIDYDTSSITMYLNNLPVDAKRVTEIATEDESAVYEFNIDPLVIGQKSSMDIRLEFKLNTPVEKCDTRVEEGIWFFVAKESYLDIKYDLKTSFTLEDYYGAFVKNTRLTNTSIAIPDTSREDIEALGMMGVLLGKKSTTVGRDNIVSIKDNISTDYNNIVLDYGGVSPAFKEVATLLPIGYDSERGVYASEDSSLDELLNLEKASAVQLIKAPSNKDKSILVVSAKNRGDLLDTIKLLSMARVQEKLSGNAAVINNRGVVVIEEDLETRDEGIEGLDMERRLSDDTIKILIAIGIILALLVIGAVFIIRNR